MTEDIITQVEDEYKQLQRIAIFKKSLPIIVIFTIITAVYWNVYEYYKTKSVNADMEASRIFIEANFNSQTSSALIEKLLTIVKTSDDKIAELAILRLIQENLILYKSKKEARDLLYKIANDQPISEYIKKVKYQDLTKRYAKYLYVSLFMDDFGALDEQDKKIIDQFISDLTNTEGAFYDSALLSKAIFLGKTKSLAECKSTLQLLINKKNFNEVVRKYAQILLHNINVNNTL